MSITYKQKYIRTFAVMLFIVLGTPFPVSAANASQAADIAAIKAEIIRLISVDYPANFKSDDVEKWPAMFTDDAAVLLSVRPTILGRAEIRAFNVEAHKKIIVNNLGVDVKEVRVSGKWAFCWGDFVERATSIGSNEVENRGGRFFVLWERQADGGWKIIADMGNSALVHGR